MNFLKFSRWRFPKLSVYCEIRHGVGWCFQHQKDTPHKQQRVTRWSWCDTLGSKTIITSESISGLGSWSIKVIFPQYQKKKASLIFSKKHLLGIKGKILRERCTFPAKLQHKCNLMLFYTGHTVTLELGNYHDLQKFKITFGYYLPAVLKVNISISSRYSCNTWLSRLIWNLQPRAC